MPQYIMVLNDGETFTNLEGCTIVDVSGYSFDDGSIEELLREIRENESVRDKHVAYTFRK